MSRVASITYSPDCEQRRPPDRYHRVSVAQVNLVHGWGIEGDIKGSKRKRQINVMSAATLAHLHGLGLKTAPGALGEQLVLDGIDVAALPEGTQLALGGHAVIELGELRTGCDRFEEIQRCKRGDVQRMLGRLATVVTGGTVAIGDVVRIQREGASTVTHNR